MIINFLSKRAKDIFNGVDSRYSRKLNKELQLKAKRLLDQLNTVIELETLRIPPSNKLKKLTGNLSSFWRIKIDKQWAIIFKWNNGEAFDVDIIDYH